MCLSFNYQYDLSIFLPKIRDFSGFMLTELKFCVILTRVSEQHTLILLDNLP